MIKKYLWITVLIFGFISCKEAPNDFTNEANAFLDAIDGKDYNGVGATYKDAWFEAHGTIIAEYGNDGTSTTDPLKFQNTRNNGTSATDATYRFRITDTGDDGQYVGIIIENSGDTLRRTIAVDTEANINWATAPIFATKK